MTTFEDLQTSVNAGGTVKLGGNITTDQCLTVPTGTQVTIDLNGFTLTSSAEDTIYISTDTVCTVKGGTVSNTTDGKTVVHNFGTVTFENCTLNANNYYPLYNCCTATVTGSTLNGIINGYSICNDQGYSDTVTLTLSGTMYMEGGIRNRYAASVVTILPGTYNNFDPTSYVDADVYTVIDQGDGTWTVTAK